MLGVAQDYISVEERAEVQHQCTIKNTSQKNTNRLAKTKTKKTRCILLLGNGDYNYGVHRYSKICDELGKQFLEIYDELETRICGIKVFSRFLGFYQGRLRSIKQQVLKNGIINYSSVKNIHKIIHKWKEFENIRRKTLHYLPLDKRILIDEKFIKRYYWKEKYTKSEIAHDLLIPEFWIEKHIRKFGLTKAKNGIKRRGRIGWEASEEYKRARRNQPHARPVVQICPRTFKILRRYTSTGAVRVDGWCREQVRRAIKREGLHDGFLWSYASEVESMIKKVKDRGDLEKKLKIWENGRIDREELKRLYFDENKSREEVAKILNCHIASVSQIIYHLGLKKRKEITTERLRYLFIDQGLQAKEIAEKEGYPVSTIQTYLSKRGIRKKDHKIKEK